MQSNLYYSEEKINSAGNSSTIYEVDCTLISLDSCPSQRKGYRVELKGYPNTSSYAPRM